MSKYSRTSKYEDLRNRLQNDAESELNTNDLAHFEQRLNRINPHNFDAPQSGMDNDNHDPSHARREQHQKVAESSERRSDSVVPTLPQEAIETHDSYATTAFNNEYLSEYLNEVKRYNIDQGNAFSTNTDLNILRSLKGDKPVEKAPEKPFPDVPGSDGLDFSIPKMNQEVKKEPKQERESAPLMNNETTDIPSFHTSRSDDLFNDFIGMDETPTDFMVDTRTKDDIAKEVQSLIKGQESLTSASDDPFLSSTTSALPVMNEHFEEDRNARQQLLNETTQMRAQLDDYEDNLSEVNDKMTRQSKVMNVILIVLIIALIVVLGVVVYWILTTKEII